MIQLFVLRPVFGLFMEVMPDKLQEGISNAASNLSEPITVGSSLLQGDTENAGAATKRFLINSTVGLGGLQDKATEMGIKARKEDLGQAMATHGVGPGIPIVLPLLGPSNLRDATGDIATSPANPLPLAVGAGQGLVRYSDNQEEIKSIRENAIDGYVAQREAYQSYREAQIRNGAPVPGPVIEFADNPDDDKQETMR